MYARISLAVGLLVTAFAPQALAVDQIIDQEKVAAIDTATDKLYAQQNHLSQDSDWFFDFTKQDNYKFSPGGVTNANRATFPATAGNGMTMAILNLGPCSMLPPHFHPRASNYVVAMSGTTNTYMIQENGAPTVKQTLKPGQMTIFPAASVHMMHNLGCDNAQLVSALNSEDPGTTNLWNALMTSGLPSDVVNAAAGYQNLVNNSTAGNIPDFGTGSNAGTEECLARCAAQKKQRST